MPNITAPAFILPARAFPAQQAGAPVGVAGELGVSNFLGKYATLVKSQKVFYASAIITAPQVFSTASQFGPVLWNRPGSGIDAHILAISVGSPTTASTGAGAIGYASTVQATAPVLAGTAAAIVAVNAFAGGGPSQLGSIVTGSSGNVVTVGVLPAPVFFPLIGVNTGAITTNVLGPSYFDVGGMFIIGPGNAGYICGSGTLTAGVFTIGVLWAELPV